MSANPTDTAAGLTVSAPVHFTRRGRGGRKELRAGPAPARPAPGRVPRVARLMALALRFEGLIRDGAVTDYAHLARLGHVTRARLTQIMNLTLLAPDIQEALLFLPSVTRGRDPVVLRDLQPLAATVAWRDQREQWETIMRNLTIA